MKQGLLRLSLLAATIFAFQMQYQSAAYGDAAKKVCTPSDFARVIPQPLPPGQMWAQIRNSADFQQMAPAHKKAAVVRIRDWMDGGYDGSAHDFIVGEFFRDIQQWGLAIMNDQSNSGVLDIIRRAKGLPDGTRMRRESFWAIESNSQDMTGHQMRVAVNSIVDDMNVARPDSLEAWVYNPQVNEWQPMYYEMEGGAWVPKKQFANGEPIPDACAKCHADRNGVMHPVPVSLANASPDGFARHGYLVRGVTGIEQSVRQGRSYDPRRHANRRDPLGDQLF